MTNCRARGRPWSSVVVRVVSGALCMLLLLGLGCPKDKPVVGPSEAPPSQVIEDFRLTETSGGRLAYELNAERAFVFEGPGAEPQANRIDVTRPQVRFFDAAGQLSSTVTSRSGTVYTKSSDIVARESVLVSTRDSTHLETDSLVWKNKEQLIQTDAAVSLRSPQGDISGIGLVSDAALKKIDIKHTVQATTKYELPK